MSPSLPVQPAVLQRPAAESGREFVSSLAAIERATGIYMRGSVPTAPAEGNTCISGIGASQHLSRRTDASLPKRLAIVVPRARTRVESACRALPLKPTIQRELCQPAGRF